MGSKKPITPKGLYLYRASFIRAVDGDTLILDVDLGFQIRQKMTVRLYGIDTWERKGLNKTLGDRAQSFVHRLMTTAGRKGVFLQSVKDEHGKYGRVLGDILIPRKQFNAGTTPSSEEVTESSVIPVTDTDGEEQDFVSLVRLLRKRGHEKIIQQRKAE